MQQENYRRACVACRSIEHLHAIGFDSMDGCRRYAESGIVVSRRSTFHFCSRRRRSPITASPHHLILG